MASDPPSGKITLSAIASALNLSMSTVSRALQNHPRISFVKRKLVQETAKRLGYRPNPSATALAQQRHHEAEKRITGEIAWLNLWDPPGHLRAFKEFDLYWIGAAKAAERSGYRLEEIRSHRGMKHVGKILHARNIRGILIPPHRPIDLRTLPWENLAAVRFGYSVAYPPAPIVTSDQVTNALLAFREVHRRGYQRIGFVTFSGGLTRFRAGYLMAQLNIPAAERLPILLLAPKQLSQADVIRLRTWMKSAKPDAIITDIAALREMLHALGHKVPDDVGLAVMSIHDGNCDAGVDQNPEHIGRAGAELLISLLHHNHLGFPEITRHVLIEGRWVDGSSLPPRCLVVEQ